MLPDDVDDVGPVEAEESLRRFIRASECVSSKGTWTVHSDLFMDHDNGGLSFHSRPEEWTDDTVDKYRRAYSLTYTIPGVLQLNRFTFQRASLPVPYLEVDNLDHEHYRHLHCAWPCPTEAKADELADLVTTLLANVSPAARIVFARVKLK